MIDLDRVNLDTAESIFVLANVPMYIARRLREDSSVISVSIDGDIEELVTEFERRISTFPENLRQQVTPFVIAVAISTKGGGSELNRLLEFDLRNYRWLREMIEGLIDDQVSSSTESSVGSSSAGEKLNPMPTSDVEVKVTASLNEMKI